MISNSAPEPPNATEALLRLVLTHAPTCLAIFDREMRYLLYSQHWVKHLPVGGNSLSGRTHPEVLPGALTSWVAAHQRALAGETVASDSDFYHHPDGSKRYLSWEVRPWTASDGEIGGSLITFQELTHQVGIESKLRSEMEAATATNLAKARLLAATSFEVRAAMNSIIGMAHLCLRSDQNEKDGQHLQTIIREAGILTSSFDDILDLSRVETGTLQLESAPFDFSGILTKLSHEIGLQAEEKGIEFIYQLPPSPPPPMIGDAGRLRQVLTKLCESAVNLTDQGEVELSIDTLERERDSVTLEFSVRDTGPAFTPQERETLMAPFVPGDNTGTSMLAQTRLSLSICKSVVALMNGQMLVTSEPAQGNVFTFTTRLAVQPEARVEEEAPPNSLTGARVLVVDDHRLARKTMARLLKSFDFEVTVAESGAEAITLSEEACTRGTPVQFVFMDYLMPGMNGLEATARLKENLRHRNPPKVILMTGRPMEDKQQELEDSLLDGYIAKPFTPSLIFYAMLDAATAWPAADPTRNLAGEPAEAPSLGGTRVLLVEDDPINQEIVHEILGDAGVRVDLANNGREGLDLLELNRYDAVLMDIQMPVMDGYEATCRIRGDDRFLDLPIIALTASAMTLDRHASLEVGMNAHVAKPINPDELFAVLADWMEPPADREDVLPELPALPNLIVDPFSPEDLEPSAAPPEPEALPPFRSLDFEQGVALLGGKEKLFRRVLEKFATNQAAADREIRAALDMNDRQGALRLVHTLKGLAGSIAAETLRERVVELEAVLKKGAEHEHDDDLMRMSVELQRVIRELNAHHDAAPKDGSTRALRS